MTLRSAHPARRAPVHDERGVVLVIVGLAMVAILAIAAIVIDLGQARASKRDDQSMADTAALAAGYYLSGRGSTGVVSNAFEACKAAINSVQTNAPAFAPALTAAERATACAPFPINAITGCTSTTAPVQAVVTRAKYVLTIRYPIPAGEIADPRFVGGVGADDGNNRCERMKVSLQQTDQTFFAPVIGTQQLTTAAGTVVRSASSQTQQGVAALLLLERVGCGSLQTSGGGSGGYGVVVRASGPTNPGVIQADSAGIVNSAAPVPCSTNSNASGFVVYGTALPAASGGGPSITAEDAANGAPGVIGIYAVAIGSPNRGGAVFPGGLSRPPSSGGIASRQAADDKYNKATAQDGNLQVSTMHAAAYALTTMTTAAAAAAGYAIVQGGDCSGMDTSATPVVATKIFVACSSFSPGSVVFPNATDVVFSGKVNIGNNKLLSMPAARSISVRGCASGCNGGGNFAIANAGTLLVNTGQANLPDSTTCASREGPGSGGSTTNWTRLATFGGPMLVTGLSRLCQTFVYLGANAPTYERQAVTAVSSGPENYPSITQCSAVLPCPKNSTNDSYIQFSGGSGNADWSAPNQLSTVPTSADLATYPFEDIALWTETSSASDIKGQGSNSTQGVYFLPNATVTFTGQATQSQPLNAQFIVRSLNVSSQGSLFLKPNPADSVITPIVGGIELIR